MPASLQSGAAVAAQETATAPANALAVGQPSAAATSVGRQAPADGAAAQPQAAQPAVAAENASGSESGSVAVTRRPRGETAPTIATGPASAPGRRQTTAAVPGATTMAADVPVVSAPTQAASDQPRPSSATVVRNTLLNPSGTRSQASLEMQATSTATQFAPATGQPRRTSNQPSITPDAPAANRIARSTVTSDAPASPTNVESPVVAQSQRGVADPAAQPARLAMAKAVTGTAGVDQGRNLDRARPAADSPAMVASASARRTQATQDSPPGPALAPQAPALVRRSVAGADTPGATMRAESLADAATTAGAPRPDQVAASASAAVTRADANAVQGPVTAASGSTEIDLGPERVISEGAMGRASGGGQPVMNFAVEAKRLARSTHVGGAPLTALAAAEVVPAPTAPTATGGGRPENPESDAQATAVARTDAGDAGPVSGGPTRAVETGPATEVSMAEQLAESVLARAELAEAVPGIAQPGGGEDEEDPEERRRRLAREAGRLSGPNLSTLADAVPTAGTASAQAATGLAAAPTRIENPMDATDGASGAAAAAAVPDDSAVAMSGPSAVRATRAAVPQDTPTGPAVDVASGAPLARSDGTSNRLAASTAATAVASPADEAGSGDRPQVVAASTAVGRGSDADTPSATGGGPASARAAASTVVASVPLTRASAVGGGQPAITPAAASGTSPQRRTVTPDLAAAAVAAPAAGAEMAATGNAVAPQTTSTDRMAESGLPSGQQTAQPADAPSVTTGGRGELLAGTRYTRAEAVEGARGQPEIGGGTATARRQAAGPLLATDLRADRVAVAGAADSGGIPDGSSLAAQGNQTGPLPVGRQAEPDFGPVGARAGETIVDVSSLSRPGLSVGPRSVSPSLEDGPSLSQTVNVGTALRRAAHTALPPGSLEVAVVDLPGMAPDQSLAQASTDQSLSGTSGRLDVARRTTSDGLAVNLDAVQGPGGLGLEPTIAVGLNDRRALSESMQVQARSARFVRHEVGGLPDVATAAIVAAEPFRQRMERTGGDGPGADDAAPPPLTEETIELGLGFLARQQLPDGSWSLQGINGEPAALVTDTGATALALLAFQGAGYNHREHKYANVVRGGVDYLLKNQKEDGDLFLPQDEQSNQAVWMYSHALATLAMCEAYGMTQDPGLREPAQRAMDFCIAAQHPERGGWRYLPQYGSDTSVTGWMMMALKSGDLAGLETPRATYDKIRRWLDTAQQSDDQRDQYRYNPYAPDTPTQRHGRVTSKTMTSVGLLMRLYLGWDQQNPNMISGAQYLAENLPEFGRTTAPERDTYYWYYATQVMYHMGGDYWQAWNGRLHPLLVESQVKQGPLAGSWDPRDPVPDRWGPHAGRLYVTTMNLLSLEVYYRHLPLYKDTL
jgi:hypothetical protein